jgi:hypothetical protein
MPFIDEGTLERIAAAARQTASHMEAAGETTIRRAADVLEVGGTAAVLAWADARYGAAGQATLLAVPVDLWVALAGLGMSWFGWAGRYGRDAEMVGAGGLATYLARLGTAWGAAQRAAAPAASTQGGPEIVGGIMRSLGLGGHQAGWAPPGGRQYVVTEMAAQ